MPIVTMTELVAALRATVGARGMPEDELRVLADYLMSFFGFETEVVDNKLDPADRDVFYMLEEEGLLKTRREEVLIKKGKMWRIHYWVLQVDRIKALARGQGVGKAEDAFGVYDEIPEDVWARQEPAR